MLVHCNRGLHLIPYEFSCKWQYFYEKYLLQQMTKKVSPPEDIAFTEETGTKNQAWQSAGSAELVLLLF